MMRGAVARALLIAAAVSPLAAQDTTHATEVAPWRTSHFPYFTIDPNNGLMGIARVIVFRQAAFDDRVSLRDAISLEAGYSVRNAWRVTARGAFPHIHDGWRLETDAEAAHTPRFGDPDLKQELSRQTIGLDLTRHIAGPFHIAARIDVNRLSGPAVQVLSRFFLSGVACPDSIPSGTCAGTATDQTDSRVRLALVMDTRDREYDTQSGLLMQLGYFDGEAAEGYTGSYGLGSAWLSPATGTRMTARVGYRDVTRSNAYDIQMTMPAWENPFTTLGGPQSDRALAIGQDPGRGLLMAGAEIRHDLHTVHNIAALTFVAFVDAGRSFSDSTTCRDCGDLQWTLKGWTVGAGGGFAIRIMRDARLTVTAARANEKTRWYVSSGWAW